MPERNKQFEYPLVARWFIDPLVYNMTPQEFYCNEHLEENEGPERFVFSVENPPTQEENGDFLDVVADAFTLCIRDHIRRKGLPELDVYNEPVWPECWDEKSGHQFEDYINTVVQIGRVLRLNPLRDPRVLSREFITAVQEQVLSRYPLWCVYVMDQFEEDDLMIYPEAIRSVSMTTDHSVEEHFEGWLAGYLERHERARGPGRRQILWMKRQLKEAVERLSSDRFVIMGHFDNANANSQKQIVWTLQMDSRRDLLFRYPLSNDSKTPALWNFEEYGVAQDGELVSWYAKEASPWRLIGRVCDAEFPLSTFVMSGSDGFEQFGTFDSVEFKTDAELKVWEQATIAVESGEGSE